MTYEVSRVIEGTLDHVETYRSAERAYSAAERMAREARTPYAVYVIPHYCDESGECCCSSWLSDHHPYLAQGTW